MIAKALMPWLFVKRNATWTPYAKVRSDAVRSAPASSSAKAARRSGRRMARGPA